MPMIMPVGAGGGAGEFGFSNGYASFPALNLDDLPVGGLNRASASRTVGSGSVDLISSGANTSGVTIVSLGAKIESFATYYWYLSIIAGKTSGTTTLAYSYGYNGYPYNAPLGAAFPIYVPPGKAVTASETGGGSGNLGYCFITYVTGQLPNAVHIDDVQTAWGQQTLGAGATPGGRLISAFVCETVNGSAPQIRNSGVQIGEALMPNSYSMYSTYVELRGFLPLVFIPYGSPRQIHAYGFIYADLP